MLINPIGYIRLAQEKGVAIPAFNIHNMETVDAVVRVAAQERSPVMLATTASTVKYCGINFISHMARAAAETYDIPVALHMDHCDNFDLIMKCLRAGYTSVMIDASKLPYEQNVALVSRVVEAAHAVGVVVEGELGRIGGVEDEMTVDAREATFTVPEEAVDFVARTGIDSLAIAIGTAHGMYKGEPKLDFDRLAAIRARVTLPLVLHGASGVPDAAVRRAIAGGISKANIATELKLPMAQAIRGALNADPNESDPRRYLEAGRQAVMDMVRKKIRLFGSNGLV
ncbi:MAG: class II fructose-bisphosphate aldolase [Christensenellales bacterium]|jgi:tagatose bisphosphate family class II aldolase